jgi:hypothetical protein
VLTEIADQFQNQQRPPLAAPVVRMSPYFPFSARVYVNQHHWLANRLRPVGIDSSILQSLLEVR